MGKDRLTGKKVVFENAVFIENSTKFGHSWWLNKYRNIENGSSRKVHLKSSVALGLLIIIELIRININRSSSLKTIKKRKNVCIRAIMIS